MHKANRGVFWDRKLQETKNEITAKNMVIAEEVVQEIEGTKEAIGNSYWTREVSSKQMQLIFEEGWI